MLKAFCKRRKGTLVLLAMHFIARWKQSLLVEGGRELLQSFIDAGLWDEVFIERTPRILGQGVPAPDMGTSACFRGITRFQSDYLHYFRRAEWSVDEMC